MLNKIKGASSKALPNLKEVALVGYHPGLKMNRLLSTGSLLALSLTAIGCQGRDASPGIGESNGNLVRVELGYTQVAGQSELGFDVQAHFVQYRSFDSASIPALLGLSDFSSVALESCSETDSIRDLDRALASATASSATGVAPSEVALLDAGRLELLGPQDRAALTPRHYPDLVPFVYGVVYGGDEQSPISLALGQSYQVSSEGGAEVGPFAVSAVAPQAFPTLSIGNFEAGRPLELHWMDATPGEPILLELKTAWRGGSRSVHCRVSDTGAFIVPRELVTALLQPNLISASISAARVKRANLEAPSAGRGELVIALRDVVPIQVQP